MSERAVEREALGFDDAPTDLLRRLRGLPRLVALIGSGWGCGEAVIAADPLRELTRWDDVDLPPSAGGHFGGGWIGVWGYPLGAEVEPLPPSPHRPVPQPPLRVGFYDVVLRRAGGQWWIEWLAGADPARVGRLRDAIHRPAERGAASLAPLRFVPGVEAHAAAVARAVERIAAGDLFQANVCGRFETRLDGDPLDAFCHGVERLRPAFAGFVSDKHGAVASWSPELFLRRRGGRVLTSPIKGTAPLSADPAELTASAKDRAENVMIVDLMRNDLGRVAVPGSVRVPALTRLERHAVWHLVSDVSAEVEATDSALLRATFPPGSVTGAPKVRAMELTATDLEATGREAYTGALGYVSPGLGLELSVVIRTLEVAADGRAWIGAGGGIVADSVPRAEVAECFDKIAPIAAAFGTGFVDDPPQRPRPEGRPAVGGADPGQGVFTTLRVDGGVAEDLDAHVARLSGSARELYGREVGAEVAAAARAAAGRARGPHRLRLDLSPHGAVSARVTRLEPADVSWTLGVHRVPGGLGGHKWADRSALPPGEHVLVVDEDDTILETDRASFFVVADDGLHTPPLDGRLLPGTMRARVIAAARERGLPVHERRLVLSDLAAAHEAFATNALRGIVPVAAVSGHAAWATPGPVTRAVLAAPGPAPAVVRAEGARLLVIDNHDSFVFNLVQYARELGAAATVVRADRRPPAVEDFSHVLVSPGPGAPREAGASSEVVRAAAAAGRPVLGVCLGHQVIGEVFGGVVRRARPVHGRPSLVHHGGRGVLSGLPTPFAAARYHSLAVEEVPDDLEVTAQTAGGIVMAVRHRTLPVEGVQFHPESILTSHGHALLSAFLATPHR